MTKARKRPDLVCVTWIDATKTAEEITTKEPIGTLLEAVGWVVKDNHEGMLLSMEFAPNRNVGAYRIGCSIPRGCIQSVYPLTESGDRIFPAAWIEACIEDVPGMTIRP